MIQSFFADMHIHIGSDMHNNPVKITASQSLTLTNILKEASRDKGIHMLGVIDCQAPAVQEEIKQLVDNGEAFELADGGVRFEDVTLLLGSEIEVYDEHCQGPIHVLCYFPNLEAITYFSEWLTTRMKNITLSSQRYYGGAKELQYKVKELGGIFIPAHIFTPFKSLYGKGVQSSLQEVLDADLIDGIELGLSADTSMADNITELHNFTFLSNSDAHSLAKIAREHQEMAMQEPTFKEFYFSLHNVDGRHIARNFGMNPKLGKYYTTVCAKCLTPAATHEKTCSNCGSNKITKGVFDRISELSGHTPNSTKRPPYLHQVPLEYLPTLGPKTFRKLLTNFQTEMNIIHYVSRENLARVVPEKLADSIINMRNGKLAVQAGGGGKYGTVNE